MITVLIGIVGVYTIMAMFVGLIIIAASSDMNVPLRGREILGIAIMSSIWPAIIIAMFSTKFKDRLGRFLTAVESKIYKK